MSVKKQIPSLCKLYSIYEEIPEEVLDETDVDNYFYLNNFLISHSQHLRFWKNFHHQSHSITPRPQPKKGKIVAFVA